MQDDASSKLESGCAGCNSECCLNLQAWVVHAVGNQQRMPDNLCGHEGSGDSQACESQGQGHRNNTKIRGITVPDGLPWFSVADVVSW